MKDEPSKVLKEVWEWKKAIYNEVKVIEIADGLAAILENAHKIAVKNWQEKSIVNIMK